MDNQLTKALCANRIGDLAVKYIEALRPEEIIPAAESEAMKLLAEIKAILDDGSAGDPECFRRIDAIVDAFAARGISTSRHDW